MDKTKPEHTTTHITTRRICVRVCCLCVYVCVLKSSKFSSSLDDIFV